MLDGVAVVTGASRGIGLAIAARLSVDGARVAGCGRSGDGPAGMFFRHCDVADGAAVKDFAAAVHAELGPVRYLVNNAGLVVRKSLTETTEADWDAVVDANLKGTFLVTRAFADDLVATRGRVVNIASISGRQGTPRLSAYCAAKHGVVGLTRALAEELRPAGVCVNAVCPGAVDTDMLRGSGFPPLMSPGDIAGVVDWLLGAAPDALTGSVIDVFG
jgi:3-oxoacyl-[acyl-carrier protein] reductase